MLAQSFKSAADLGITEPQLSALMKTLVLLETGKLVHVPYKILDRAVEIDRAGHLYVGLFNMGHVTFEIDCGTVGCIKGTAEMISGIKIGPVGLPLGLCELFYTDQMNKTDITPAQAATALRSYLTTGNANWAEAVA